MEPARSDTFWRGSLRVTASALAAALTLLLLARQGFGQDADIAKYVAAHDAAAGLLKVDDAPMIATATEAGTKLEELSKTQASDLDALRRFADLTVELRRLAPAGARRARD